MSFLNSREALAPQGIGKPVRRREDARLLTGGATTPTTSRCPARPMPASCGRRMPHAAIAAIDVAEARAQPA
ncbi:MAG: hypothetical protein WDO24_14995 [Pseudomonadota bacterium]